MPDCSRESLYSLFMFACLFQPLLVLRLLRIQRQHNRSGCSPRFAWYGVEWK